MCVPACLLMVMERFDIKHNIPGDESDQLKLARFLNFNTSERTKDMYGQFEYTANKELQGCKIYCLNEQLFAPNNIPLMEEYHSGVYQLNILTEKDFEEKAIIISYNDALLKGVRDTYRHVCILESINRGNAHLIIPVDDRRTRRLIIGLDKVAKAIKDIKGGIWILHHVADDYFKEYNELIRKELRE